MCLTEIVLAFLLWFICSGLAFFMEERDGLPGEEDLQSLEGSHGWVSVDFALIISTRFLTRRFVCWKMEQCQESIIISKLDQPTIL